MRQVLYLDHGIVELTDGRFHRSDGPIAELTPNETSLLRYLAERPGVTLEREDLLREVWGWARGGSSRTLDTTVKRLRHKIEPEPRTPTLVQTVRGTGYRWCGQLPWPQPFAAPSPPETTLGRAAELELLRAHVDAGRSVTVRGPAGIGKTALVAALVRQLPLDRSLVWVEARELATLYGLLVAIGRALDLPDADEARIRGVLASRPGRLLVLDDTDLPFSAPPGVCVVRTTRAPGDGLSLSGLLPADARMLVLLHGRRVGYQLRVGDDAAIDVLVAEVGGNPLALSIAASELAARTPQHLVESLGHTLERGLAAVVEAALERLDASERAALRACAMFPSSFPASVAQGLCGDPALLASLVQRSLVDASGQRLTVPPWVRTMVTRQASPDAQQRARDRMAEHLLAFGEVQAHRADHGETGAAFQALRAEHENLCAAFEHLVTRSPDAAARMARVIVAGTRGRDPSTALRICRRAIEAGPSEPLRQELALSAGAAATNVGRMEEAQADFAVALVSEDLRIRAWAVARSVALELFRNPDAEQGLDRAEADCADPDLRGYVAAMHGAAAIERGRVPDAIHWFEQAFALHRSQGRADLLCATQMRLGLSYANAGRYTEGRFHLDEARREALHLGTPSLDLWAVRGMAMVDAATGELDRGIVLCTYGRAMAVALGDPWSEGECDGLLGILHHLQGDRERAAERYPRALATVRATGGHALPWIGAGYAMWLADLGRHDEARQTAEAATAGLPDDARGLMEAHLSVRADPGLAAEVRRRLAGLPPGKLQRRILERILEAALRVVGPRAQKPMQRSSS